MSERNPTITPEQAQALRDYAAKHGRTWKDKLNTAWANGQDSREPNGPLLRQVRNMGFNLKAFRP